MIDLTVKTLDSRNHSFSVADDFTVKQLKEHIAEAVSIPAESQRLIYCGRVLQDEKTLTEYDVNGKVIHLVQRAPPSSNGSSGGGGGIGTPNTTTGQRRPWRNTGNAMYLGAMAFPAEIMDATGIAMQQPRHCLSHSRLVVVRIMLRRAEAVLARLENPSAERSPDNASGSAPAEPSVEDDITNGNNPVATVEISTEGFEIRNPEAGEGSSEPQQDEARASERTPPESEPQSATEGGREEEAAGTGRQSRYPHPPMLAELMDRVTDVNTRLSPFMSQYRQMLIDDPVITDQATVASNQRLFSSVSEIMHNMSHAYHALSDIMCDFSQPPPRSLRCRPVLIHHSAVVHTGIPIQVSANLGAAAANQPGASSGSDTANSNGRPSENSSPVEAETSTAPSAPPPSTTATSQPHTTPPVAHVAPRIGTVGGGGPGFEFLVDMAPGSITIDSVEAHVVTNASPPNSADSPPNNWQNPPEFVQNLISALAGQFMGATLQQFQFPSQQNVGTNTQNTQQNTGTNTQSTQQNTGTNTRNTQQNTGTNTQTTGSTQTQTTATTATATQSTGTSTQSANVSTQNTGTSTQNAGISTQNTGTNTPNAGTNPISQPAGAADVGSGGGGGAAGQAAGATPRANARPHVHLPHVAGLISSNHFDPFLPCNSHHIRSNRSRGGRPSNGSNAQANGTPPPPPPRNAVPRGWPPSGSISISLQAEPVISVEARPVRSSDSTSGNQQSAPQPNFPPELQALFQALTPDVTNNDPAATIPQQIAHLMQAIQGSQGSQNPPTIAQLILNVPGYSYVAGESVVLDICMTLAQSLSMVDVIQLGLGQSACLARARPQLRQLITRLNSQPPRLVERLNAELRTHYSIFDNVRLREDVDLPASISRYNQRMLPDIINIILDENLSTTSFHRVLMNKCSLYVNQLCALLRYCCIDANGFESLLRACVNRVTSGIPAALQEWTTASSMQNLRTFISSVNTSPSEIQQYVVFRATSPQPATVPAPAPPPVSQPATTEPMDTQEAGEVRLELPDLNGEVPPVADDAPSSQVNDVMGWQGALPSEWVPIITRDSQRQRRLSPQGPFSDAYLSGMPSKRRKLISSEKPQGNLSQVISESMATALDAAGVSSGPEVDAVVQRAGQDSALRAAYREQVRTTISRNLDSNPDFVPDKYPNTTKYFDKKK